jgi:adenylate cyclase class 2
MKIEYEAKFLDINKDKIRKKLRAIGARLIKSEFLQKRFNFHLPGKLRENRAWLRVRNESDKITLSLKKIDGKKIHNQKELNIEISDFETGVKILKSIGCEIRMYQETKREIWQFKKVEITIDTWPFLRPFVEIESDSEVKVKMAARKLGMDYKKAVFGPVGRVYKMKYGISPSFYEGKNQKLTFESRNPFLNHKK